MLERSKQLPDGVLGVRASGRVTKQDYTRVLEPMLDAARSEDRRIRFLFELAPDFEGVTPGAAWEDAKIGLRSMRRFDGCALVGDAGWLLDAAHAVSFFMPCPVRCFGAEERAEALKWLEGLPGPAISHRILPGQGVIVVEVTQALRREDFDALAATADAWIESHGALNGLVIHARRFPGWENLAGLATHLRFVRDHHREIRRIGVCVDGVLATLAPQLAARFVSAEIRSFPYGEVDAAIAWASGGATPASPV